MGCEHYGRHCHVRAECCREWVACRLCHDAQFTDHEIDRHAIKEMRCDACQTEQPVRRIAILNPALVDGCAQTCSKCQTSMGVYFCKVCNLFDDEGEKKQIFHCDGCGICRVGGRANFFHCVKCCGCYPLSLQDKHKCLEGSMHRECAICLDVTFASLESVHVLPCGHVLHSGCWQEYIRHGHYRCPSCRTRMFWTDEGESGDEDDNGDGEDDDIDTMDEDGESEGESFEGEEELESDVSDVQVSPSSLLLETSSAESDTAQRLVDSIFHALASSPNVESEQESEGAPGSTHTASS